MDNKQIFKADIDIDLPPSFNPMEFFSTCVQASMVKDAKLVKHPAGVYFQNIPKDIITNLASIPFNKAREHGYVKFDLLHAHVLDKFESKQQLRTLARTDPDWTLLLKPEIIGQLIHIHEHIDLIRRVKPSNVQELADCLALIRPGKAMLINKYLQNRKQARKLLYQTAANDQYQFKRAHAIGYALTIVAQLNLIELQMKE